MPFTHSFRSIFQRPGETLGEGQEFIHAITGGAEVPSISETIPGEGTTTLVEGAAFNPANLQSLYMLANKEIVVTFDDDNGLTVAITLQPNAPYQWHVESGVPNPLQAFIDEPASVVQIVCNPANDEETRLEIRGLCDPTP